MRTTAILPRLAAALLLTAASLPAAGQVENFKRHRVAVLDFEESGERVESGEGKIAAELLTTNLVNTGRFEVIEREQLQKVIKEQEFGLSDLVSQETAAQIGSLVGVEVIITGTIYRLQNVAGLNVKLISTQDATLLTAHESQGTPRDRVNDLVDELLTLIIGDFPLEGYVIGRDGQRVVIDKGTNFGLYPGMEFQVYVPGRELRHPVTNEIMEREEILQGTVRVEKVKSRTSDCTVLSEESEGAIARGHLIKSLGFELGRPDPRPGSPGSSPAAAAPPPARRAAAGTAAWTSLPGRPTIFIAEVHDDSDRYPPEDLPDRLRSGIGDALHREGLGTPVLTDLDGVLDELRLSPEHRAADTLLLRLVIKEWKIPPSGETDVDLACRVYEPRIDEYHMKKSFEYELKVRDYASDEEMIDFIVEDFLQRAVAFLRNRI